MLLVLYYLHLKKARRVEQQMRLPWGDLGLPREQSFHQINLKLFVVCIELVYPEEVTDESLLSLRLEKLVFKCPP